MKILPRLFIGLTVFVLLRLLVAGMLGGLGPTAQTVTLAAPSAQTQIPQLLEAWFFNDLPNGPVLSGTTTLSTEGTMATILGAGATATGSGIDLPGGDSTTQAYIDLPNGFVSDLTDVSLEFWITIQSHQSWQRVFDFGTGSAGELTGPGGVATGNGSYLFLSANRDTTPDTQRFEFNVAGSGVDTNQSLPLDQPHHFMVTFDDRSDVGQANVARWYLNGEFIAENLNPQQLATLMDNNNWLGRSQYTTDANSDMLYESFEVYDGAFTDAQVLSQFQAGPDDSGVDMAPFPVGPPLRGNYCVTHGGVGLFKVSSGTFPIKVEGTPVAAYLYWAGRYPGLDQGDDQIEVSLNGGAPVTVTAENSFYANTTGPGSTLNYQFNYQSENLIPALSAQLTGAVNVTVSGLRSAQIKTDHAQGVNLVVISQDAKCPKGQVDQFFGLDIGGPGLTPPRGPNSEVLCVDLPAPKLTSAGNKFNIAMEVQLGVGGVLPVSGTDPISPSTAIFYATGTGTKPTNLIGGPGLLLAEAPALDGNACGTGGLWDDFSASLIVPAGHTYACFQIGATASASAIQLQYPIGRPFNGPLPGTMRTITDTLPPLNIFIPIKGPPAGPAPAQSQPQTQAPPAASPSQTLATCTQRLSLATGGNGTGSVTSTPAGINCPPTCNASFAHNTVVTLTATASPSSTFVGWVGPYTSTNATYPVTMDGAKGVFPFFYQGSKIYLPLILK